MTWQKCPICNGIGMTPFEGAYGSTVPPTGPTCETCKGERIIHEATGLPPSDKQHPELALAEELFFEAARMRGFREKMK